MDANTRFTILTFPQYFDGTKLQLNIVFLPRNQNPLKDAIEQDLVIPDAVSFATANLSFTAKIINSLENFPVTTSAVVQRNLTTAVSGDRTALFNALASQFSITNLNTINNSANINNPLNGAPKPRSVENSVHKYLPLSYRKSFNFTTPVNDNAKIDDSYHCALKSKGTNPAFLQSPDTINWGQVFAFIMRQPLLAQKAGIIYSAEFDVDATLLNKGGWLYIDIADSSDYKTQQTKDSTFIKLYAARIPALKIGKARSLFAPVQFPVLPVEPPGNYDDVFIEVSEYDDGFAKIVHSFQPVSQNFFTGSFRWFSSDKRIRYSFGLG